MMSRRQMVLGLAALGAASAAGCRRRGAMPDPDSTHEDGPPQEPPRPVQPAAPKKKKEDR